MSRTRDHYDEYYSPTSPVGKVRAERAKYLIGVSDTQRYAWERAEDLDPSNGTVVDPAHEDEGAQLLLAYYEAVLRDRHLRVVMVIAFLGGGGGIGILLGWLASSPVITLSGICLATFFSYLTLTGQLTIRSKARATKIAFKSSGYFRDRTILDAYLITTQSAAAVWEATDLEQRRRAADHEANHLRGHLLLTHHREADLAQLQNREQELRRRIVDMLDPQRSDDLYLSDEHAAFAARNGLGSLTPEGGTQTIGSDKGDQPVDLDRSGL